MAQDWNRIGSQARYVFLNMDTGAMWSPLGDLSKSLKLWSSLCGPSSAQMEVIIKAIQDSVREEMPFLIIKGRP